MITMKQRYYLLLAILLGVSAAQVTYAVPPSAADNASSPMQALANTGSITTSPSAATAPLPASSQTLSVANSTTASSQENASQPPTPADIDCNYTLPESNSSGVININPDTIIQWANHAATQTFTYDFRNYDKQFNELKHCYTTAGWESFLAAMKASNNLKVTQEEHLFVSAKVNGQSQLVSQTTQDVSQGTQPTWVVKVPVLVTYQNQDREVTQDMYIDLTIKPTYGLPAHLGIHQIIASPKQQGVQ